MPDCQFIGSIRAICIYWTLLRWFLFLLIRQKSAHLVDNVCQRGSLLFSCRAIVSHEDLDVIFRNFIIRKFNML